MEPVAALGMRNIACGVLMEELLIDANEANMVLRDRANSLGLDISKLAAHIIASAARM